MPNRCDLLDLAKDLLPVIEASLDEPFETQLAHWQAFYALRAPSLPERLYADYADTDGGWLAVARDRVWPHLAERMNDMKTAAASVRTIYEDVYLLACERLSFDEPLTVISYVGLGNGAGWAATWEDRPAVLLGLENIAELHWRRPSSIRALLSHEIGHLFMTSVRKACDASSLPDDPLLHLYEEGFAQHSEHVISGGETWHCASQPGWLEWCFAHEAYLADKFLAAMGDRKDWQAFFGSWFDIDGWRQTGYFLGCRFVERLARTRTLRDIARLDAADIKSLELQHLTATALKLGT